MTPLARLPGIYVDRADPPAPQGLPRMDVAVFVGIAERGPAHRAIAVESVAAYDAVFGGDVPIAFDPARGETIRANLPASVRAFFSNGGRRCWVIRVAMTAALAARWRAADNAELGASASRARFALSGVLTCVPSKHAVGTALYPALLAARSLGSWADATTLAARVLREAVLVDDAKAWAGRGFSFADRAGLAAGDMLEVAARNGSSVRYAKVVRVEAGIAWACWLAAFATIATAEPAVNGHARIAGRTKVFAAKLTPGRETALRVDWPAGAAPLAAGRWLRFDRQGGVTWLIADRVEPGEGEMTAIGRAWRQTGSHMPSGAFAVRRCTLEVVEEGGGTRRFTAGLGLAREHPAAIQRALDDDAFYAPPENRAATSRAGFAASAAETARLTGAPPRPDAAKLFGGDGFTAADRVALRTGWLPLGLGAEFGEPARAITAAADPLARDGLGAIDHRLFLDPRLAGLTLTGLAAEAERLRDLEETQLFGIHAAIEIPSDLYSPASLIAVPDAVQPDWAIAGDRHQPPAPQSPPPATPRWTNHLDGCPPDPATVPDDPDWSRFLDAATEVLATPAFVEPPASSRGGGYTLAWQEQALGTTSVLEEAGRCDFADAAEVLRAADVTRYAAKGRGEGVYYYRLRGEHDGNTSGYATWRVVVRASGQVVVAGDAASLGARVRRIQVPLLRLCAATGDWFALLSLPRDFRAREAADHARALARLAPGAGGAGGLGADEARALSYGAPYHPWLAVPRDGGFSATVPDGAIAGLYARRATDRGAWIAPASDILTDIVGLDPATADDDLAALDAARVNVVRRRPAGFTVLDEDTLSPDPDWRRAHVRRLMMLIRRAALRRGLPYVFEPNGDVTRRAIRRSFTTLLDGLQAQGAFAAGRSGGGYRVQLPEVANDRDAGRLVVEIAVSPAAALRTLTLRLTQQGNRLTIGEVA